MASIPQQYREPLRTWVQNNIHKAVHTATWTVEVEPPSEENPDGVYEEQSEDYLDVQELCMRLGRKIWKNAPELRGKFDLSDLEELIDDRLPQLMNLAGVTAIGCSPLRYDDYKDEDPDA
jgi:hypothetical protein